MKKIIVFGGGQVGSSVAKILSDDGNDITLVDYDKDVLTALKEKNRYQDDPWACILPLSTKTCRCRKFGHSHSCYR